MIVRNYLPDTVLSTFFLAAILTVGTVSAQGTYSPSWQAPIGIRGMAFPPGYPKTYGTPQVTRGSYYWGELTRREQLSRQMLLNDPSSWYAPSPNYYRHGLRIEATYTPRYRGRDRGNFVTVVEPWRPSPYGRSSVDWPALPSPPEATPPEPIPTPAPQPMKAP